MILDELDILKDKSKVRETLGYLPQEFGVYPKVSSYNILNHIVSLKGISNKGLRKDLVESLLTKTNLWEVRNKRIVRYFALFNYCQLVYMQTFYPHFFKY